LVRDVLDGRTERITARGVHTTRRGTVEQQPAQMRSHRAVDNVGNFVEAARNGMQRGDIDTGDLRLSHTR
jgi:hypothetical protein